ncbi:MAG: hypothetical protein K1X72_15725 [Pyrinomonadaceae bacterium]|nr:hypothetical protein [Pyrinomonadaceae bacterium]
MNKIAFVLIFIFSLSAFSQTNNLDKNLADNFYQSLGKSDPQLALDSVLQTFQEFNVRWHPDLVWIRNPYNEKINEYINFDKEILISNFVKKSEAADYWTNWSKLLTDGRFDHKKFFKNEHEMLVMANYNQLILATHEFGHHLDYLYNINTYGGDTNALAITHSPLNCTEGFADQVAFVFATHLAQDKRFAELRRRYLELINAIDGLIPEKDRASFAGISSVTDNCGKIDYVEDMLKFNPRKNPSDFRKYVSVYFNRWRILLTSKDFPSMQDFIETRIFHPFYQRIKLNDTPVSVKTNSEIKLPAFERKDKDGVYLERLSVLNQKGEFRNFVINFKTQKNTKNDSEDWQSGEIELQNDKFQPIGKIKLTIPKEIQFPYFPRFLATDDDEFYLYLFPYYSFEDNEEKTANCQTRLLYRFKRVNGIWQEKFESIKDAKFNCDKVENLISSPNGKLYLLNFKDESDFSDLKDQNSNEQTSIYLTEIDRENLKLKEPKLYGTFKFSDFPKLSYFDSKTAIDDNGKLIFSFSNSPTAQFQFGNLAQVNPNGVISTLAGTIPHYEDGENKELIGFRNISDIRQIDEKTIGVLDWNEKRDGFRVREIKLR